VIPQPARTVSWRDLLDHPEVVERSVCAGEVGLMAFHGGLEGGTLEIAEAAADASGASLYTVAQPADLRWHVPSSTVDPDGAPMLAAWLAHVDVAIAVHGYGRIAQPRRLLLGGSNRQLAAVLEVALLDRLSGFEVVTELAGIPPELRGLHPANPVNRPPAGGVQLELPPSARGTTSRPPDPAWGPGGAPARVVDALVDTVREWTARGRPRPAHQPADR
jgi:phage replication-related protein YjqB (UPF0714/DUF867 family)